MLHAIGCVRWTRASLHLDPFIRFGRSHGRNQHTDKRRPRYNVRSNSPHLALLAVRRCGLKINERNMPAIERAASPPFLFVTRISVTADGPRDALSVRIIFVNCCTTIGTSCSTNLEQTEAAKLEDYG